MVVLRGLLVLAALALAALAAGMAATLLWVAKWPPANVGSDLSAWLRALALLVAAAALGVAAVRLGDRRRRARLAALLPYPMNNDG